MTVETSQEWIHVTMEWLARENRAQLRTNQK